ncbi:MAG: LytTR family DNA-binding domain-containing protein [Bacteroidota bacterium]
MGAKLAISGYFSSMASWIQYLRAPYPYRESPSHGRRVILFASLFVGLFLLIFQPFGLAAWNHPLKTWALLGYGAVTALVLVAEVYTLRWVFPRWYNDVQWTLGKEILTQLIIILLIAGGNLYYSTLIGVAHLNWQGFLRFLGMTMAVGLFPSVLLTTSNFFIQTRKHEQKVDFPQESHPPVTETPITLIAENGKDQITLNQSTLRYIVAADNYAEVVWDDEGQKTKSLLRSPLSRLEKQLNQPHVARVHRSYIANLERVEQITGNAQGYRLHKAEEEIPVSRSYGPAIVNQVKSLLEPTA